MRFYQSIIWFWLLLCLNLGHAAQPAASIAPVTMSVAVAQGKGLCWKIEKGTKAPSYLYGTMHVGDPGVTTLVPVVQKIFEKSSSVSLEVLMDNTSMVSMVRGMMYTDGRTLKDVIGDELYQKLLIILPRYGANEDIVKYMRPWALMGILIIPEMQGEALDMQLYTRALKQGKPVYGLETVDEQMQLLDGIPLQAQIDIIRSLVEDYMAMDGMLNDLLKLYLDRDLKGMMSYSNQFSDDYPAFSASFNSRIIDDRNLIMVDRMQPRLKEGNAFIAVGALHLPGEKGILFLLEQQGYKVTPVY